MRLAVRGITRRGGDRSGECSDGKIRMQPPVQEHTHTHARSRVGSEEGLDPEGTKGAAACAGG